MGILQIVFSKLFSHKIAHGTLSLNTKADVLSLTRTLDVNIRSVSLIKKGMSAIVLESEDKPLGHVFNRLVHTISQLHIVILNVSSIDG